MAYVLGFFAVDGCITVNKRGGQYWSIQIADYDLLAAIKEAIGSSHMISNRSGEKGGLFRLQIGSIEICNDLRALGFSERKTMNMTVPLVSDEYFGDFLRGYFDGDGNVWTGKNNTARGGIGQTLLTAFTSCSRRFLAALHDRLSVCGVRGGSLYQLAKGYWRLSFSVRDSLKLYEIMYNDRTSESLYLKRKKDVFERYIALRP